MDGSLRRMQNTLCFFLIVLLGEMSGGKTLRFSGLSGTGTVAEHSPAGTLVYTFEVILSPSNASVEVGFPLIINSNPLTKAFDVVTESSLLNKFKVVTTGNPILDYETLPNQFDLEILVFDKAGASALEILTVQILDVNEPPMLRGNLATQTIMIYIKENAEPGTIYQIHATDSENVTRGIKYSMFPESTSFSVSPTGTISSLKAFDSETDPESYLFNITATDSLGLSTTGTVMVNIININDESPYFVTEKRLFTVREESEPNTAVATISAKDPDDRDDRGFSSLHYSIATPAGIPNFSINPRNGVIQVATRIDRDSGTFREHPNVSLVIRVVDSPGDAPRSNETTIVITILDINDNPPVCTQYNFGTEISEQSTAGISIFNLKNFCSDIDAESPNNLFYFTGLSGIGSNKFIQNPIDSGNIMLIGNVDLENASSDPLMEYYLNIVVQNIVSPNYTNNIYMYIKIIPVNEFDPVFSRPSYVFNVTEITAVNSAIGHVAATDKDLPSTGISYSIVGGGGTRGYSAIFWIDPKKGIVRNVAKLDYETTTNYSLTVQASDNDGKFTSVSVIVYVLAKNDEPPICFPNSTGLTLAIPVDLHFGTNIGGFHIECKDRDSSPRSFRYSINSGDRNNHFTFSPSRGSPISNLILARPFDYEGGLDRVWDYKLEVFITDDNLLSDESRASALIQTGTMTVTVKVIPKPTTVAPTTPAFTLVTSTKNVYSALAWYVPFILCLGGLLLLGLLGYLMFLLAKYIRIHCPPKPKADKKPLIKKPEKKQSKKDKKQVIWELTNINAVFDGEARDPVSGKLYEFNSKSGARKWKDANMPPGLGPKEPSAPITTATTVDTKKVETSGGNVGKQDNTVPRSAGKKSEITSKDSDVKLQTPN